MEAKPTRKPDRDTTALRGWVDLAIGLALFAIGPIVMVASSDITHSSATYFATYVPMIVGGLTAVRGIWRLAHASFASALTGGLGYKSFVAWRYLLETPRRVTARTKWLLVVGVAGELVLAALRLGGLGNLEHSVRNPLWLLVFALLAYIAAVIAGGVLRYSKPALFTFLFGLIVLVLSLLGWKVVGLGRLPLLHLDSETMDNVLKISNGTAIAGGVLIGLAMFFGSLRAFFTFFTTVPIGGVWIGTAALVIVLSVMSGFESDLREKILGSNAHIQITREDGNFVEWRDVKAKVDRMPGVVASAPFAVSEVVVAANNTGMNVIIKGIDPSTIGKVTNLVSDLEDRDAMKRLDPLVEDTHDLRIQRPAQPPAAKDGNAIDPRPSDLPAPGEPIDFSSPDATSDALHVGGSSKPAHDGSAAHDAPHGESGTGGQIEPPSPYGGDAEKLLDLDEAPPARDAKPAPAKAAADPRREVVDPAPPDLVRPDKPPTDYSRPDYLPETVVKVVDIPFDAPSLSRRTQTLPGILVGRELVKQTHLYTGEEVRVVSPLSDPANPDANGTPIPYNRDYRVAGVFFTGMYEYDLKCVYVTLSSLQQFLDRGDAIDGIEVRVAHPDDTDAFIADFQAAFGTQYRVQDWKELNRSLFSALKLEKIAMFLVLGIVILVASFSIVGDLIMVVVEKAREIALLKTLGASDIGVMQLFAIQGLMIGLIGTVLGVGTGLMACWVGKRFGLPLNPDVYYIDKLPIHVEPMSVIAAASAGVLISIAATLYPAVVAARVRPAAGMRH